MNYKALLTAGSLAACFVTATAAKAEDISSRPCPYSCETEKLDKGHCRDWKEGDTCFIAKNGHQKEEMAGNHNGDMHAEDPHISKKGGGKGG